MKNLIVLVVLIGLTAWQIKMRLSYLAEARQGASRSPTADPARLGYKIDVNSTSTQNSLLSVKAQVPPGTHWVMIEEVKKGDPNPRQFISPYSDGLFQRDIYLTKGPGEYQLTFFSTDSQTVKGDTVSRHFTSFGAPLAVSNMDDRDLRFLAPTELVQSDDAEIVTVAQGITQGITTDREKSEKIHDWVTDKIAYDTDDFFKGIFPPVDAVTTLDHHQSVCHGYANLNAALHRAIGIQAKVIFGDSIQALPARSDNTHGMTFATFPDPVSKCKNPQHAWNEVLIDGKWLIQDPTWDAGYVFPGKHDFTRKPTHEYLFPDPVVFAKTHYPCGENTD